jgi:glycosyltransferase involved in cell wall biosynthesis
MRIAFYAPLKSPTHPIPSGDRRVARLLMDALSLAGHQVDLVSDFRSFEGQGDAAVQAALSREGHALAASLLNAWRHGPFDARPDMWFTYHLYYKAPDWLGPCICRQLGVPYVVAEASCAPKRARGPWAAGHAAVLDALQLADLLLCPTVDDVPALEAAMRPGTLVRRLPPFLDPAPYWGAAGARSVHRRRIAESHQLDPGVPWIVVAAMMRGGDKQASYALLERALVGLADLPWQLLVAGDGPAGPAIRAGLEQAAPGRCWFAGECQAQSLAAMYAASDLCVWPAVNEAYGMAMLEAQAAGTPVVSCAVRGVPEVVLDGVTGLLAPDADVPAFVTCVRALLQDPERRARMGQAAAVFIASERSTTQAARQIGDALDLLGDRVAGRLPWEPGS